MGNIGAFLREWLERHQFPLLDTNMQYDQKYINEYTPMMFSQDFEGKAPPPHNARVNS